ncbi:MAG TPA: Ig-like domain-containing protein [Blastocatellia bacterium]|nr:Ig-like domain-containing protein [Blastocatellia bacterium]
MRRIVRVSSIVAVVACIAALSGIGTRFVFAQANGSGAQKVSVATVQVTPSATEAEVGQSVKITVVALDKNGKKVDDKPIMFAGPFDLASVDQDGYVSLYGPGKIEVGVVVGGKLGRTIITVRPQRVSAIEVTGPSGPLPVGGSFLLTPTARVANGNPREDVSYLWSSGNPQVATVDQGGLVTAVGPGKTTINVSAENGRKAVPVEVAAVHVEGVSIEPRSAVGRTGDVLHFRAVIMGGGAAPTRWAVSGLGATVYPDGGFVADRPGSYVVTAIAGDKLAIATVLVSPRNVERELEVVGRAPTKDFQIAEQWIWGNYAYLSTISDKVLVYDLTNPAHPKLTDTLKVDARLVNDVSVTADGKIGVITREGASSRKNGIVFLDTSDPAHPKVLSEYTATVTGGVHSAFINSHYVYLTDDATGSLRVIDFKDPKNAKEVARWQVENEVAKPFVGFDGEEMGGRYLHDVQVKDGFAYLAYWRDGLVILDVGAGVKGGSPENPKLVSQFHFNHSELYGEGWLAGTHAVFRYKNYVFVGDEVFQSFFDIFGKKRIPARGVVHVIDVSDISNPKKVAEYAVPEGGSHNIWVEDDVLVMGYYGGGGRVLDVSGELRGDLYRQGREIARLWSGDPEGFRPNIPFCWGAQPHNGMIFFNDINSGLWVTKLGSPVQKGSTTLPGVE